MHVEDSLVDAGFDVVAVAPTVREALSCAESLTFDAAILDINLGDGIVWPVAERIAALGRRIVFLSSDCARQDFPSCCCTAPRIAKPFFGHELAAVLRDLDRGLLVA